MSDQQLPTEYRQIFEKLKGAVHTSSHGGLKRQSIENIEAFAHDYLVALSMLSRMRANPAWHPYIPAFQRTLLEANILLYPEEEMSLAKLARFFWVVLPAQLWENRWYYVASTAICAATALIGFFIVLRNFEMAPVFIPGELRSSHEMEAYLFSDHAQAEMLHGGRDTSMAEKSIFATQLMINNIRVAVVCFVTGVLFGLPTLIILVQTGLMLGALPALFYHGDLYGLGAWLLPHGVPEIGAILLSAGAGLKLGLAMLRPGSDKPGVRFRKALASTGSTVLFCVFLLVWAGLVESFVRQSNLSNDTRYLIAGFSLIPIALVFVRAYLAYQELQARAISPAA